MDQVTQQNAAMVEQSTAASHSLAQDAAALQTLTTRFDIGLEKASEPVRVPTVVSANKNQGEPSVRIDPRPARGR